MALVVEAVDRLFQSQHCHSPIDSTPDHTHRARSQRQSCTPLSRSAASTPTGQRRRDDQANVHMSASPRHAYPDAGVESKEHATTPVSQEKAQQIVSEDVTSSSADALNRDTAGQLKRVKIHDLAHVQSLMRMRPKADATPTTSSLHLTQYDISKMPIDNVIEMVAGVLTRITATNDLQHDHLHKQITSPKVSPQTSSVLAFHGKTVPSITILNYLGRIHKYCPTSYEVFVSLLIYFDRMTDRVNDGPLQTLQNLSARAAYLEDNASMDGIEVQEATPPLSVESAASPASQVSEPTTPMVGSFDQTLTDPKSPSATADLAHFFVVDSFNIHRLIIAGVTCASKFFSDIFYTNSRYAKVGGLPLPELNHLEFQFLLLNDFRLSVPVEELDAYSTMLVEFYGREFEGEAALEQDVEMT